MTQSIKKVIYPKGIEGVSDNFNRTVNTTENLNKNYDDFDVDEIIIDEIDIDSENNNGFNNNIKKEKFLDSVSYNLDANKKLSEDFSKKVYERFIDRINNYEYIEGEQNARVK